MFLSASKPLSGFQADSGEKGKIWALTVEKGEMHHLQAKEEEEKSSFPGLQDEQLTCWVALTGQEPISQTWNDCSLLPQTIPTNYAYKLILKSFIWLDKKNFGYKFDGFIGLFFFMYYCWSLFSQWKIASFSFSVLNPLNLRQWTILHLQKITRKA